MSLDKRALGNYSIPKIIVFKDASIPTTGAFCKNEHGNINTFGMSNRLLLVIKIWMKLKV